MQNNIIQLTSYAVIENFDHLFRERCSFPEINGSASCVENLKNLKMIFKMTFFFGVCFCLFSAWWQIPIRVMSSTSDIYSIKLTSKSPGKNTKPWITSV